MFLTRTKLILAIVASMLFAASAANCQNSDSQVKVVLKAAPVASSNWPKDSSKRVAIMEKARKIIIERLMSMPEVGVPQATIEGDDTIVLTLSANADLKKVLSQVTSTATLEFYWLKNVRMEQNLKAPWLIQGNVGGDGKGYEFFNRKTKQTLRSDRPKDRPFIMSRVVGAPGVKPIFTGKDLLPNAKISLNSYQGGIVINIEFNKAGTRKFASFTASHVGEFLAVFYGERLLTAPVIREKIPGGKAEISGFSTLLEAQQIANSLNSGILPVPMKVVKN